MVFLNKLLTQKEISTLVVKLKAVSPHKGSLGLVGRGRRARARRHAHAHDAEQAEQRHLVRLRVRLRVRARVRARARVSSMMRSRPSSATCAPQR